MTDQPAPKTDEATAAPDTPDLQRTTGKYPVKPSDSPPPSGPGTPESGTMRPPTTTGTPGSTLGAPTEAKLKRDPATESERDDTRADADVE